MASRRIFTRLLWRQVAALLAVLAGLACVSPAQAAAELAPIPIPEAPPLPAVPAQYADVARLYTGRVRFLGLEHLPPLIYPTKVALTSDNVLVRAYVDANGELNFAEVIQPSRQAKWLDDIAYDSVLRMEYPVVRAPNGKATAYFVDLRFDADRGTRHIVPTIDARYPVPPRPAASHQRPQDFSARQATLLTSFYKRYNALAHAAFAKVHVQPDGISRYDQGAYLTLQELRGLTRLGAVDLRTYATYWSDVLDDPDFELDRDWFPPTAYLLGLAPLELERYINVRLRVLRAEVESHPASRPMPTAQEIETVKQILRGPLGVEFRASLDRALHGRKLVTKDDIHIFLHLSIVTALKSPPEQVDLMLRATLLEPYYPGSPLGAAPLAGRSQAAHIDGGAPAR